MNLSDETWRTPFEQEYDQAYRSIDAIRNKIATAQSKESISTLEQAKLEVDRIVAYCEKYSLFEDGNLYKPIYDMYIEIAEILQGLLAKYRIMTTQNVIDDLMNGAIEFEHKIKERK